MQRLTDSLTRGEDLQAADCVRKLKFVDKLLEELERFETRCSSLDPLTQEL
jgi:molecular chaperone HscB